MRTSDDLQAALEQFIQTATMEEAYQLLKDCPILLTDQADILLSTLISNAHQQTREDIAMALDERRDFLRSVREEIEGQPENKN